MKKIFHLLVSFGFLGLIVAGIQADAASCTANQTNTGDCTGQLVLSSSASNIGNSGTITNRDAGLTALGLNVSAAISGSLFNSGGITISNAKDNNALSTHLPLAVSLGGNATVYSFLNSGTISVTNSSSYSTADASAVYAVGLYQYSGNTLKTLTNSSSISVSGAVSASGNAYGIGNFGVIGLSTCGTSTDNESCATTGLLKNSGSINVSNAGNGTSRGINNGNDGNSNAYISRIDNIGSISVTGNSHTAPTAYYGAYNAIGIYNHGTGSYTGSNTIGTINNIGSITSDRYGIQNNHAATINYINNSGTIAISSAGSFEAISVTATDVAAGIVNFGATIGNILNSGTISVSGNNRSGIINTGDGTNDGQIATLTNTGSIVGSASGGYSIVNMGSIGTLNNAQGTLTYLGALPTNYKVIINSPTNFGRLSVTSPFGTTTFGIYAGTVTGVSASTLTTGTYSSVLTGIGPSNLTGATSGTYGSYSWSLVNSASYVWDLIVTGGTTSSSTSNVTAGGSVSLSSIGVTANPVFDGGTLTLASGDSSAQTFTVNSAGGTIQSPSMGTATLSGVFSGSGGLTFVGSGTTVLSGTNTYAGGTTVSSGVLSVAGASPTGTGDVTVSSGGTLMGIGTINGKITVAGVLKPGYSPGYLASTGTVTMSSGSNYLQDIAGTTQASSSTPSGSTGYYSYLNISGGQFVINAGSTLAPRLSNLFTSTEAGFGTTPYAPVLGDRFRIVTAASGISGKFSSVLQPADLQPGTQFLPFYNMGGGNSLDLAVIPTSYQTTIASAAGNKNAQSVGHALEKMVIAAQTGVSTATQDQLLYATATKSAASLPAYAQSLSGEVYAASLAVIAQSTQRVQQAVQARVGDTLGIGLTKAMTSAGSNTALMGASSTILAGGVATAAMNSNPSANPTLDMMSLPNPNVWGDLTYQKGNRSSDNDAGGWSSNLYQLVFGSDFYTANGMRIGGGLALANTTLNPTYGSATLQQGWLFTYGKLSIDTYVVDALLSIGLSSSDISRGDPTGLGNGFRNKSVMGTDAMVSVGVSRPFDLETLRLTPFARLTWQMVTQSSVDEGSAASALNVNGYTGNGARGVLGIAAGSKANNPLTEQHTFKAYVGVGADSPGILNPTMNASLGGLSTTINTPTSGTTFIQAGLYGTVKFADNAYAYASLSSELRSGQTLGAVNLGIRLQF